MGKLTKRPPAATVRQHILSPHHGLDRVKLNFQRGPLGSFDREDGELLARLWNEHHGYPVEPKQLGRETE